MTRQTPSTQAAVPEATACARRRTRRSAEVAVSATPAFKTPSKLDRLEALLLAEAGASIAELMVATGWQQHSVRGAMSGALAKRGLAISSDRIDGVRCYRAVRS